VGIDRADEDDAPTGRRDSPAVGRDSPGVEPDSPTAVDHDADADAERFAEHIRYRAIVEIHAECETARRDWAEALPALQEAWSEHERKYPRPERAGPTLDRDGSWLGEGDLRLEPKQNAEVDRRCERIHEIGENVILPAILRLEAEDPERRMAGLENFLKAPDRLKEKVAGDILFKGRTAEQSLDNVKDSVRFTYVYAEERYAESVYADCARLEARFERFDRQNSWEHDQYKGVNSRWREPETGQLFEVQFHTQASLDAKELTHRAYERLRGQTAQDDEREELEAFQSIVSDRIPIPPGATEIEDYGPEKRDG
jgi:hypothetical protein